MGDVILLSSKARPAVKCQKVAGDLSEPDLDKLSRECLIESRRLTKETLELLLLCEQAIKLTEKLLVVGQGMMEECRPKGKE